MKFETRYIPMTMPKHPDYLSFVDDDIRKMFEGENVSYLNSDVLMAQLIKELRKLNSHVEAAERHNEEFK